MLSKETKEALIRSGNFSRHVADCDVCEAVENHTPGLCLSGQIMLGHMMRALKAATTK